MVFNATFNNISVKEGILKINLKFKKHIKIELKKKKKLKLGVSTFWPCRISETILELKQICWNTLKMNFSEKFNEK
jgi:hypothetical protein